MFNFAASFEIIWTNLYKFGVMTKEQIAYYVRLGTIGPDAYKRITGDEYHATPQSSNDQAISK